MRQTCFQKLLQTHSTCRNKTKKNVWEKSNDAYSLSIRVQTTINHISNFTFLCFFTTISTSKKMFFFRTRAGRGIARHIDESRLVWTHIDNVKLANKTAKLAATVIKIKFLAHAVGTS